MRRVIVALAAMAVLAAGCQDKPIDPLKPKVETHAAAVAMR
jgi:hypothetical protein